MLAALLLLSLALLVAALACGLVAVSYARRLHAAERAGVHLAGTLDRAVTRVAVVTAERDNALAAIEAIRRLALGRSPARPS